MLAVSLTACADMAQAVRAHAALDLGCEEDQVVIVDEVSGIYRVHACGQDASYRCTDSPVVGRIACERLDLSKPPSPGQLDELETPKP